jgi:plasmid stability protein
MVIELPEEVEAALKLEASVRGTSAAQYARELLVRDLAPVVPPKHPAGPYKTSRGILAKYGPAPSAEEIDENRREMFRGFGEDF